MKIRQIGCRMGMAAACCTMAKNLYSFAAKHMRMKVDPALVPTAAKHPRQALGEVNNAICADVN